MTFCKTMGGTRRFGSRGMMISMGCKRSVCTVTSLPSWSSSENEIDRDMFVFGAVALRSATAKRFTIDYKTREIRPPRKFMMEKDALETIRACCLSDSRRDWLVKALVHLPLEHVDDVTKSPSTLCSRREKWTRCAWCSSDRHSDGCSLHQ